MVPVRKTVEISDGVKVELLFTPRVSVYQGSVSQQEKLGDDAGFIEVMERYADIMYFAALNAWELDGHGTQEDFPHKRGDFHGWMTADPKGFGEAVQFAACALSGKTVKELAAEGEKRAKNGPKTQNEVKKKSCWISRLMNRSKRSS